MGFSAIGMRAAADRSINPEQERMMAKRALATTVEINASHHAADADGR
jgi:hypothetical protein